jgi:hypothetical protein
MNLFETLGEALKPETLTYDINEAIAHMKSGGKVFHCEKEVIMLHRMSLGDGFGKYKGHLSGDWMNGIFTLK